MAQAQRTAFSCCVGHEVPELGALVVEAIAAEQITMSLMVPTMINLLLQSPSVAGADLSSLRAVLYGASPNPAVLEAAAFGVPHVHWGEAVHVEVVTKPGTSVDEGSLIEHCRALIAGYKVPRSINLRTHEEPLPKSGAGKILKRDLRAPYWEGHNRSIN